MLYSQVNFLRKKIFLLKKIKHELKGYNSLIDYMNLLQKVHKNKY